MILTTKPSDPTNHGNLVFQVKTTASSGESSAYYTDAITIDGKNANVGIGTSTPLAKLEAQGPNIVSASPVVIKKAKLLNLSLATSAYYGGFAEFWMGRYAKCI